MLQIAKLASGEVIMFQITKEGNLTGLSQVNLIPTPKGVAMNLVPWIWFDPEVMFESINELPVLHMTEPNEQLETAYREVHGMVQVATRSPIQIASA